MFKVLPSLLLTSLMLNELPQDVLRTSNMQSRRAWTSISNCFKTTIYSNPRFFDSDLILKKFDRNMSMASKIAQKRGSTSSNNICNSGRSFFKIISIHRVYKWVMEQARQYRNADCRARRQTFLRNSYIVNFLLNACFGQFFNRYWLNVAIFGI